MNSQSTTETTVCVIILTRRKLQRFIYGTEIIECDGVDLEHTTHHKYLDNLQVCGSTPGVIEYTS